MSNFDWINYNCECPNCESKISNFQTKDGDCNLEEINIIRVDNFYTYCGKCDTWVEFDRIYKQIFRMKYGPSDQEYKYKIKLIRGVK